MKAYFVYIMTNNSGTLHIGVTNNLARRVREHKQGMTSGFTQRYNATRLVYCETTSDVRSAIGREKQIKGWARRRKIDLVASMNPTWRDLSEELDGEIETLRAVYPERSRRAQGDSAR